jgi:hypothetical protein
MVAKTRFLKFIEIFPNGMTATGPLQQTVFSEIGLRRKTAKMDKNLY